MLHPYLAVASLDKQCKCLKENLTPRCSLDSSKKAEVGTGGVIFCNDVSGNRHSKRKLIKRRITHLTYIFQENLVSFVFLRYCDNLKFMKAKKFQNLK